MCMRVSCLMLPLCLCSRNRQGPVQLRDLAVDERTQRFFEFIVVPLQLSVVLPLIGPNQSLVLSQGILAPACIGQEEALSVCVCVCLYSAHYTRCGARHHLFAKSLKHSRNLL